MKFYILTLFKEMIENGLNTSILKRAMEQKLITCEAIDIRDYTENKHKKVDDYPYGGGAGMLMQAQPIYDAYLSISKGKEQEEPIDTIGNTDKNNKDSNKNSNSIVRRTIYVTPQGTPFTQTMAEELACADELVFLCGHYEGVDERVLTEIVTDYVSIGDYVLTGGELPAMVMIDAIARLVPGVLNNETSAEFESFQDGLLEYPQYTRPVEWHGLRVPDILLSGNHKLVEAYRHEEAVKRTKERRPDLFKAYEEANMVASKQKKSK